ncbi:MAG: hypothetical protein EBR02_00100 [Alphaproteobacteria bacterium]|nr:hypothetical protein [Alphaproteobacteria bacterium]
MTTSQTRALALLACVSLVSLLAACGPDRRGYYDSHGTYVATNDTPHNKSKNAYAPMPGGNPNEINDHEYSREYGDDTNYTRRGYYDYNGYYMAKDSGLAVPGNMFPPRGMCRVWFIDRSPSDQPEVESCSGIRSRVPAGAYVIYGG